MSKEDNDLAIREVWLGAMQLFVRGKLWLGKGLGAATVQRQQGPEE